MELLDDYIRERLSDADRAAFEQQLSGDPSLQQALKFQQRIADGLRQARAAELKTMLSNVPVGAAPAQVSVLAKVAGGLVLTGLVVTGIYYFLLRPETTSVQPADTTTVITDATEQPGVPADGVAVTPAPQDDATTPATRPVTPKEQAVTPVVKPTIDTEALVPPTDQESTAVTVPHAGVTETKVPVKSSIVVETDNTNSKYTFHYQFKEGKLILYGTFEKNLYEILEFFSDNKRTMFLFHKANYYLLDEQGTRIKSLTPIRDEVLLQKLRAYRSN